MDVRKGIVGAAIILAGLIIAGCDKDQSKPDAKPTANSQAASAAPAGESPQQQPVKLSQYDADLYVPSIGVAPDGAIHVAFVERQVASPYTYFVFHRSSTDGGKTWSEPKNLSEDMPGFTPGYAKLLIDSAGRVYVIWRTGLREGLSGPRDPGRSFMGNIIYRVLDHGSWSKILPISRPGSTKPQDDGAISTFACIDGAGKARVVWNTYPNRFHPEQSMSKSGQTLPGIGAGLISTATLDGTAPVAPVETYMPPVTINPSNPDYDKRCDGFSALSGYVDADGGVHFLATLWQQGLAANPTKMVLVENGMETPALTVAGSYWQSDSSPATLLLDSKGKQHIIILIAAGEHQTIRDYTPGSDADPRIILTAKEPAPVCAGFQAFQGPGGKMAVITQTNGGAANGQGESWLSTSDGGPWSTPQALTSNIGKATFKDTRTGSLHGVYAGSSFGPGPGAAAWDHDGHLVLALVNIQTTSAGQSVGGATYAGSSTAHPMLFFLKP